MGRIFGKAFICAIAGVLGWVLTEPLLPANVGDPRWQRAEQIMVLAIVSLIGLAAGIHQGLQRGGQRNLLIAATLGLVGGACGGTFGYGLGGALVNQLFGSGVFVTGAGPTVVIARTVAFAPLGLLLGAAIGATMMSVRGLISGAMGGLIGGMVSGMLFDVIGSAVGGLLMAVRGGNEVGIVSRAVTGLTIGLAVGLFTALFDAATRQAWLRLVLGRNEGKEWPLDAAQTLIGRDERAHVPLFGDPNVQALHAVIRREGSQYILSDPGTPMGVGVNGQRVAQAVLSPGDTVNVGSFQLQFLMKAGAAQRAQEARARGVPISPVGQAMPQTMPQTAPQVAAQQPLSPTVAIPAGGRTWALVVTGGPLTGQRFPIQAVLEVGREPTTIPLAFDSQTSRRHAQLQPTATGLQISDLGSTNGTFLNGQRIQQAVANPGDVLQIGASTFRIEG